MLCVQRLPDTSLTHALMQGGKQFFGWGQDRHLLADLYDASMFNTKATGRWGKKVPELPNWPRPTTEKPEKKKVTVKSLWAQINSRR